ncbi:MAG: 4Fe-4S dicluster domain-containing protein [Desulfobacterales bacterium]|nr:4Fe-4S dicluster domain-containing protein [Desulfobacterales bacterium]
MAILEYHSNSDVFTNEVIIKSNQNLNLCYQCRKCAAGCTVADETDYFTPDRLIRAILLGDKSTSLNNKLVWKCVSCYTCGTRCPNDIQTGKITETLKKMSKEAHIEPLIPEVYYFHDSFLKSIRRWGRINEMEFMGSYELKNLFGRLKQKDLKPIVNELIQQAKLALSMLKLKRLHFSFEKINDRYLIRRLFRKAKDKK